MGRTGEGSTGLENLIKLIIWPESVGGHGCLVFKVPAGPGLKCSASNWAFWESTQLAPTAMSCNVLCIFESPVCQIPSFLVFLVSRHHGRSFPRSGAESAPVLNPDSTRVGAGAPLSDNRAVGMGQ
jgi:hypothetical protein